MKDLPASLLEAVRYYSDLDLCEHKMALMKWDEGKASCPKCGGKHIGRIASRRMYQCKNKDCRKQFSVKVGTIFEDSPLGLDKWFVAVWCIANAKNGISSCELARALGVTQKSAWFMLHRIREAMRTGSFRKLQGEVEVDETYIGGKAKNMHFRKRVKNIEGRGPVNKTAVQGIIERGGEVRTMIVRVTDGETLRGNVMRNVDRSASVYTDALPAYVELNQTFTHKSVDHISAYVKGRIHTNSIENFWSLLKRALKGTYTKCAPFHLQRYCDEQAWRFNHRRTADGIRFESLLQMVVGRRLTWRQLCAVGDCGFMGIK